MKSIMDTLFAFVRDRSVSVFMSSAPEVGIDAEALLISLRGGDIISLIICCLCSCSARILSFTDARAAPYTIKRKSE